MTFSPIMQRDLGSFLATVRNVNNGRHLDLCGRCVNWTTWFCLSGIFRPNSDGLFTFFVVY